MTRKELRAAEKRARDQIRSLRLPFAEVGRGKCEQCGRVHYPEGPRRFIRVWFRPLYPGATVTGSLYSGKRRCAPCTMAMSPEDLS